MRIAITHGVGPDRRRSGSRRRCWTGTRGMIMTSRAVGRIAQRAGRVGQSSLFEPHHLRIVDAADQMDVVGRDDDRGPQPVQRLEQPERSEEHTSELQSLMRISYAVFCLKKKIIAINTIAYNNKQHTLN